MNGEEAALKFLGMAIEAAPSLVSLIATAVHAEPDHPLADRIAKMLPEGSLSAAKLRAIQANPYTE